MIQEFSFSWNGRRWNGYFNALANETVIAHFEEEQMREAVGNALVYSKNAVAASGPASQTALYDAIRTAVERRLGKPVTQYLN